MDEKAQIYTMEGMAASLLMLLVITYAAETASMKGWDQDAYLENDLRSLGQDILDTLDYAEPGNYSKLKRDIAGWDGREYVWSGTGYIERGSSNITDRLPHLTGILKSTVIIQGIAHDLDIVFLKRNSDGTTYPYNLRVIYNGEPSHKAVTVSRKLVLDDRDNVTFSNPVKDIDPSTGLYNIVDLRLVLWRT